MLSIHIQLEESQYEKTRSLAKKLNIHRSTYIRRALDSFNLQIERRLLAEQFRKASKKCRDESIQVCREFESLEAIRKDNGGY